MWDTVHCIIQLIISANVSTAVCELTQEKDKCKVNNISHCVDILFQHTHTLMQSRLDSFSTLLLAVGQCVMDNVWPYLLVVLHVQVVLMSVLVTVGQRNDGDGVDRLHESPLRQSLCHHLTAKVWHDVPDRQREGGEYFSINHYILKGQPNT